MRLAVVAFVTSTGGRGAVFLLSEADPTHAPIPINTAAATPAATQSTAFGRLLKLTSLKSSEGAGRRWGAIARATGESAITSVRCCTATGAWTAPGARTTTGATGATGASSSGVGAGKEGAACAGSVAVATSAIDDTEVAYATSAAIAPSTITELAGSSFIKTVAGAGACVPFRAGTGPRTSAEVSALCGARTSVSVTAGPVTGAASSSHDGRNVAANRSASSGLKLAGDAEAGPLPPGLGGSVGKATGESLTPHRHLNNVRS